jgi:hypothetical protein
MAGECPGHLLSPNWVRFRQNGWCPDTLRSRSFVGWAKRAVHMRTSSLIQLSNSQSESAPVVCLGARVRPSSVSLSFPPPRGMARRKAHAPDFAGAARKDHSSGRPGSAGSDASADASASFDAPSRYLSAFAFLGDRTMRDLQCPAWLFPATARGHGCVAIPASTASRPTITTSRDDAPRRTERIEPSRRMQGIKKIHPVCISHKYVWSLPTDAFKVPVGPPQTRRLLAACLLMARARGARGA